MKKFVPNAARVSEFLRKTGLEKYSFNLDYPGFRVAQWVLDEYGNPTVKIEWFMGQKPDVGLGARTENRVYAAHRERLGEIMGTLREIGYAVVWGWDPDTGEPDSTFIVVISPESAELDAQDEDEENSDVEPKEDEKGSPEPEYDEQRLQGMSISYAEAREAAMAINRAYNVGRDEVARRLEHRLMSAVLTAIVYGTDEPVDLAAVALSTQHLPFAR